MAETTNLAPGWAVETAAIWAQFPARKGILDLTNRTMDALPEELFRMRKLTTLTVNNCGLSSLAGGWDGLGELKSVKAESNSLTDMQINLLTSCGSTLEVLSFAHNNITEFSPQISSVMFLTQLNLSHNGITKIPDAVIQLGQLTHLDLSHNKITELPEKFHECRKLEVFKINDNELRTLSHSFGLCSTIMEFSCSGNPFDKYPELQGIDGRDAVFSLLRNELRKNMDTRVLLFDERDSKNNVRFEINEEISPKHPILTACTVEKLVKFLTPAIPPDQPTFKTFLLCYSYFVDTYDIIELLYIRFKTNFENISSCGEDTQQTMKLVQLRVFAGLMKFLAKFSQDGIVYDQKSVDLLKKFAKLLGKAGQTAGVTQLETTIEQNKQHRGRSASKFDGEVAKTTLDGKKKKGASGRVKDAKKKRGSGLFDSFRKKKKEGGSADESKSQLAVPAAPDAASLPPPVISTTSSETSLVVPSLAVTPKTDMMFAEPKAIAEQLALEMNKLFSCIPISEFMHQAWAKDGCEYAAPNILTCIDFFNKVSQWIATEIVSEKDLKLRVKKLSHVLDIAQESMELCDYSSTYSIASALMGAPISRLKQTWACIDEKRILTNQALNRFADNSGNYRNYRSLLQQKAGQRCIPYLGLVLSDLTFTEEGNSNFVNDGDLANFAKFRIIHRILDDFQTFQSYSYRDIELNDEIRNMVVNADRIEDEDEMYNESLRCEASRRMTVAADPTMGRPSSAHSDPAQRRNSFTHSDSLQALPPHMREGGIGGIIASSVSMMEISTHTAEDDDDSNDQ